MQRLGLCIISKIIYARKQNVLYVYDIFCRFSACASGFFGNACSVQCPYPSFGLFCGDTCNCGQSECNPAFGCKKHGNVSYLYMYLKVYILMIFQGFYHWKKCLFIGHIKNSLQDVYGSNNKTKSYCNVSLV